MLTIPTILTLARIGMIPVVMVCFYLPWSGAHILAAILFALAAITDWLDGYLARNLSQVTRFGAFLDPVADKLMVAIVLVLIVGEVREPFLAIPAAIIVGREIVISALREWMAELGKRTSVTVNFVGKIKTGIQMIAIVLLLIYAPSYGPFFLVSGVIALYIAAALTLWSMIMYLKAAWLDLTLPEEK